MCRRNQLRGSALLGFGLGLIVGYLLESWFLCCCGGIVLIALAVCMIGKR